MGYTTTFSGVLSFKDEPTVAQLRALKSMYGVDSREDERAPDDAEWYYCDFQVTDELDGIEWDGGEKFYGTVECLNWMLRIMRAEWPDFGLVGEIHAQGGDVEDRWVLKIQDGVAVRVENPRDGRKVRCPDCEAVFYLSDAEEPA